VRSPTFLAMRRLNDEGKLAPAQQACFVQPRPREELYDLDVDPHEQSNRAGDPRYAEALATLRKELDQWQRDTDDRIPDTLSPDEFDRTTGQPLKERQRPRPAKKRAKP
jgi:hypothetical protein